MSEPQLAQQNVAPALAELPFSELYIRVDDNSFGSRYKPDITRTRKAAAISGNFPVPARYDESIEGIRDKLLPIMSNRPIGVIMHEDLRLRYTVTVAADNETWAALRPIPLFVPSPDELRLSKLFVDAFQEESRRKGLILIGGKTGQGKTTTGASMLKNLCVRYGGTLFTIEDPVEYMMAGALSENSWAIQHDLDKESDWERLDKIAKRFNPDWLFFGEIRSMEAAEQLIAASARGHLVVATIHSSSVADTVGSLLQYLKPETRESARRTLANSLRMAVHQTMTPQGPYIQAVRATDNPNDVVRKAIDDGNIHNISNALIEFKPVAPQPQARR